MARIQSKKASSLVSLFFTFGVDQFGATLVFPLFTPLFLVPKYALFPPDLSFSFKVGMLGLFLAVFPLMQFLFSPWIGEYADHHGRKKTLLLTTFGSLIGYLLCGIGIHFHSLSLIFLARVVMGIGAGNLSVCLSSLADLARNRQKKVHYFSYGSAIAGATFIFGPFIGGKLSDPTLHPYFTLAFPLFAGASLALLNVLVLIWGFQETLEGLSKTPFLFAKGLHTIVAVLKDQSLRVLYLIYFLYLLSWNLLFLFMPTFALKHFGWTSSSQIGNFAAFLGFFWICGTAILHRLIDKVLSPRGTVLWAFFLFSCAILAVPFATSMVCFLSLIAFCTVLSGLVWPICAGKISHLAPLEKQGKAMGLGQSTLSLAMLVSSLLGAFLLQAHTSFLFILSALSTLVGGVFAFLHWKN